MITQALQGDISSINMLFPETDPEGLMRDYREETSAILVTFGQHGFNLFWFGWVALIGAILILRRRSKTALVVSAVVIGFADLGALFATVMIGRIDVFGVLIFSGTVLGIGLSVALIRSMNSR
ncbi:MAG: hypothetical protein AAGA88_11025 [Pseudomonadota bacterium]